MNARTESRKLRAEIIHEAQRCEYWAGEARKHHDEGRTGSGICLAFVARQRSEHAFAAAKRLAGLARAGA